MNVNMNNNFYIGEDCSCVDIEKKVDTFSGSVKIQIPLMRCWLLRMTNNLWCVLKLYLYLITKTFFCFAD